MSKVITVMHKCTEAIIDLVPADVTVQSLFDERSSSIGKWEIECVDNPTIWMSVTAIFTHDNFWVIKPDWPAGTTMVASDAGDLARLLVIAEQIVNLVWDALEELEPGS